MTVRGLLLKIDALKEKFPRLVAVAQSEIFHFILLCIISLLHCKDVFKFRADLDIWDEAWYLLKDSSFPKVFFTNLSIGPLYTGWYSLIRGFTENLPQLYYLSSLLVSFAIGPIFYLFLRRNRFTVLQSLLAFFLILFYPPLVTVSRFVNNFALFFTLTGLLLVTFAQNRLSKLWLTTIIFFFATYSRPELAAAFMICFGIYSFYFFQKLFRTKMSGLESLKMILLLGLLFIQILGAAAEVHVGNITHSLYVFKYYSQSRMGGGLSYFNWIYGNPNTLAQAIGNNPIEFFHHVVYSMNAFFPKFWKAFASFEAHEDLGFYLVIILILFLSLISKQRTQPNETAEPIWKDQILFLILMTVPVFLSGIVFGANTRYFIFPMICVFAFIPKMLFRSDVRKSPPAVFLLIVVFIQISSPAKFKDVGYDIYQTEAEGSKSCGGVTEATTKVINLQKQFKLDRTLSVLSNGNLYLYTGNKYVLNCGTVEECFSGVTDEDLTNGNIESYLAPFFAVIRDRSFNHTISLMPAEKKRWFTLFFSNPEKYGFKSLHMNCTETALLVRTSVLAEL